ncbi:DAK2 domain-containing protein [Halonatronum saccharophilum]|uniref:DAK2 domain-containing protein n=1 Tax=Halonatronum saccharophilum TaxID=150060 RepID=UPI000485468A|nr:DAK2 domain-containing protein [Halonatronum saccharophilum]
MLLDSLEQGMKQLDAAKFHQMLLVATNTLKDFEAEINDLNVFPVPDGDTGTNMYLTLSNAVDEIKGKEGESVGDIAKDLSKGALMGARGNSGVILSQLLRGLAEGIGDAKVLTSKDLANGLERAAQKAYQAVMKPVEGTILTVAKDVGEKAKELSEDLNVLELLAESTKEAERSVLRTPELLTTLKEAGVVDAGGKGYQIFLAGLLQGALSKEVIKLDSVVEKRSSGLNLENIESEFGYCTEFIVKGAKVEEIEIREVLDKMGDSLIAVKSGDVLKVHIHTDNPGLALQEGLKHGQLTKIKIDNMSEQHEERLTQEIQDDKEEVVDDGSLAVLAVAAGEGLADVFRKLGAKHVIQGGQSMNPSIQDILNGIQAINSSKIIILPNNKNVIATAEQVKEISDKDIAVIPTKTIPQGVTTMMVFNPEGELAEVSEDMKEEMEFVKTGEITYAVRDTKINDLDIIKGDILGLAEGDIKVVSSNYNEATVELLDKILSEDDSLITIYSGEDVSEDEREGLLAQIEEKYPDLDVDFYNGGQPIYYYIISVE